jgi:uncharacterized membrane protein
LVGHSGSRSFRRIVTSSPQDVLRRRYANGDIDQQEYEQRLKALGGSA